MDPIDELKSLHEEYQKLESSSVERILKVKKDFLESCQPLSDRRRKIVRGETEPSEEELRGAKGDGEGAEEAGEEGTGSEKASEGKGPKGVPGFWRRVLKKQDTVAEAIQKRDEEALSHLEDVRCVALKGRQGFRLEFSFSPNPFFSNKLLVKEVRFVASRDGSSLIPVAHDGHESSTVSWKGVQSNLTLKVTTKSGKKGKGAKGRKGSAASASSAATKTKPCPSFFHIFSMDRDFKGRRPQRGRQGGGREEEGDEEGEGEEEDEEDEEGGRSAGRRGGRGGGEGADVRELLGEELVGVEVDDDVEGRVLEDHLEIINALREKVIPSAMELFDASGFDEEEEDEDDFDVGGVEDEEGYEMVGQARKGGAGGGGARQSLSFSHPLVQRRLRALRCLQMKLKEVKRGSDSIVEAVRAELSSSAEAVFSRRRALVVGSDIPGSAAVPKFWLWALKANPITVELIRRKDALLLAHLADIRCRPLEAEGRRGFVVDFEFTSGAKDWMENEVLTKTFVFSEAEGEDGPLVSSESTAVTWQDGMELTVREVETGRGGMKLKPCPSFFQIFDESKLHLAFAGDDDVRISSAGLLAKQKELGLALRDAIVPNAVDLFLLTKEWAGEDEEEDEEEEEEEEDGEEEEDNSNEGPMQPDLTAARKRQRNRKKDESEKPLICGLSRNAMLFILTLLILSSQLFLFLDYVLMYFGY